MTKRMTAILLTLLIAPFTQPMTARADTDFSNFSLSRAAPADAFITVAARGNAERKFLTEYWGDVSQAFWDSGIVTDVWDLIIESVPDEDLAEVEEIKRKFGTLCEQIGWGEIFEKEMLYSARFSSLGPQVPFFYEGMLLGRCRNTEIAAKNYNAIKSLLSELSKLIEAKAGESILNLTTDERDDGLTVTKCTVVPAPFIEINLAVKKDMLLITFGSPKVFADTIQNLSDSKEAKRIVDTPRFKAAFEALPPAEDTVVFFDADRMIGMFRNLANMMERQAAPAAGSDAPPSEEQQVGKIMSIVLKDISIIDYSATVEWTDGHRVFSDTRTTMHDGAKSSGLYGVLKTDQSIEEFAQFLPKEATSFNVSTGLNVSALYDYVIDFVEKNIPDGKQAITAWNDMQKNELKMNIKQDVLGLFEGSSVSVTMEKDSVWMLRVTDTKKADAQLKRLIDLVKQIGQEQGVQLVPVKVGPEIEFTQVSHPMLMMSGISPVIGCTGDYFILGSSPNAVKTCLQTARGKHANVKENVKWKKEALAPEGPVQSISFNDQSNMAAEMQEGIMGISMALGFMQMGAGQMPPEAQKLLNAGAQMLSKLSPVVAKLNFFESKADYTTFKDNVWTTHSVQNYKSPAQVKRLNSGDSPDESL